MDYNQQSLQMHETHLGKIEIVSKVPVTNNEELSVAYTPGVAQPCRAIYQNKEDAYRYTATGNLVAVVTDGTAVLGLGDIGPTAALPVMEGKSILFKQYAGVDAFPVCLDTTDTEEIIQAVKWLAPTFGGVNLEDIASPKCFEIETRLEQELDIPVFHDDQHGTAIVVTAALLNALKLVNKNISDIRVVLNGPGAAGTAIIKMIRYAGVKHIIACDEYGILHHARENGIVHHKKSLCDITNPDGLQGSLADALVGADVFIGVSVSGCLTTEMIQTMATDPIVFAMANPTPEIPYDEAIAAGVKVMGTGRSDTPNQINNVLAFPGIFRGALDGRAKEITYEMKFAAVKAIANIIPDGQLSPTYIIPSPFNPAVAEAVANAVKSVTPDLGVSHKGVELC